MIPKFRAWFDSEMYDKPVVYDGEFYLDWREFENGETYNGAVLMQSTGLKDKNGKEIFEGDIVKFSDCDDDAHVTPVVWNKNYACFGVSFSGKYPISFDYLEEFYTELKDIEVVGNIYENPKLLGNKIS